METTEFREQGHRVVDLLADYLESIEKRRVFPDVTPAEVEALFDQPLPREGTPLETVLDELEQRLLPTCTHN